MCLENYNFTIYRRKGQQPTTTASVAASDITWINIFHPASAVFCLSPNLRDVSEGGGLAPWLKQEELQGQLNKHRGVDRGSEAGNAPSPHCVKLLNDESVINVYPHEWQLRYVHAKRAA